MRAVTWIVIGLIAGWIAAKITHTARGLFRSLTVGLVGAALGALLFARLGVHVVPDFWGALITAAIGAVALLWVWQAIRRV